jgi:hypothetical protein
MAGTHNRDDRGDSPDVPRGGSSNDPLAHGVGDAGRDNAVGAAADLGAVPGRRGDDHRDRDGASAVVPLRPAPLAPSVQRIPGSIVKAICQIQATVEAVKKSQKNKHGDYMFASTDDIYAAVTRKMGEVGLICMALEDCTEIKRVDKGGQTAQWMHAEFSFVLATETDTWSDARAKRTLYIQVLGPQTFQAAQSYAEKAYLRSLFKLPTGDMDLDSMPQAETEEEQNDLLAPRKRKSSSAAKKDGTTDIFNDIRGAISGADGPADLHLIKKQHWSVWQAMPTRWLQILDAEFEDKLLEFDSQDLPQE